MGVLFLINYIIGSTRPPHTIFSPICEYDGAINEGTLKVIIHLLKEKVMNFGR